MAVPVDTPVTTPELLTVTKGESVIQFPPVTESVRVMVEPTQTVSGPLISLTLTGSVLAVRLE